MTARIPPNPNQSSDLRAWARQLYDYILSESRVRQDNNPRPILLSHQVAGGLERAAAAGILMYDPVKKSAVISVDGRWEPIMSNPYFNLVEQEILGREGDVVSILGSSRSISKFGRTDNSDANILQEMQMFPAGSAIREETLVSSDLIDSIVSDNAADTMNIVVEGSTWNGGALAFSRQTVTMTGQTPVSLATPLARVARAYVDWTSGTPANVQGEINVYESGVSTVTAGSLNTPAAAHITLQAVNQSEKAFISVGNGSYLIITKVVVDLTGGGPSGVTVKIRLERKPITSNVWRPFTAEISLGNSGTSHVGEFFEPFLYVPPNYDFRLISLSDTNNTEVSGNIQGMFAGIIT